MDLTLIQKDALTELIHLGYGRAAGAMSDLIGYPITLEVPEVAMHEFSEIASLIESVVRGEVARVDQVFSGPICGNALLVLDEEAALILSQLFADEWAPARGFDASAREVITEIGNILLNACLSVFGNLLRVQVSFAVPRLHLASVSQTVASISIGTEEKLHYGLLIHTRFHLRSSEITGYLVIILEIVSLDRLLRELENWKIANPNDGR
jgi:chemotaxis protein CheC